MYRRRKPDVFEVMIHARTHIFIRRGANHYLMISALAHGYSVIYFHGGSSEPLRIEYVYEQLQFFDGKAWDLPMLLKWLESREAP